MKKKLRESLGQIRKDLSKKEAKDESLLINDSLIKSKEFNSAKTILFYLAINNEVDTTKAIAHALLQNKRIAVPVTEDRKLIAKEYVLEKLVKGPFSVLQPEGTHEVPNNELDLIIVPGIAFDLHGGRVGYGKGFYDAFLKQVSRAYKVALAYDFQVLDHFPKEPHDMLVDKIITEKRIIDCAKIKGEKI